MNRGSSHPEEGSVVRKYGTKTKFTLLPYLHIIVINLTQPQLVGSRSNQNKVVETFPLLSTGAARNDRS